MLPHMKKIKNVRQSLVRINLPIICLFLLAQCGPQPPEAGLSPQISSSSQPVQSETQNSVIVAEQGQDNVSGASDLIATLIDQLPDEPPKTDLDISAAISIASSDNQSQILAEDEPTQDTQSQERQNQDEQSQAALSAALALLSTSQKEPATSGLFSDKLDAVSDSISTRQEAETSPKYGLKLGLLLPLTGEFARLGAHIRAGVELALLNTGRTDIQLSYFDTKAGSSAQNAASMAVEADIDIVLGPLFTTATQEAYPILAEAEIPMLLLGNNQSLATPSSWVLGATPEQQLDVLLGAVMMQGTPKIAILSADDDFGIKMEAHLRTRLAQFGLQPARRQKLGQQILEDETALRDAIQRFAGYRKPVSEDDNAPHPLPFDVVYIAGGPDFVLRTAPVLSYYDASPERAIFIGTDFWAQPALITEPALQGAVYTQLNMPDSAALNPSWAKTGLGRQPDLLGKLGFDATSVVLALYAHHLSLEPETATSATLDWQKKLVHEKGFNGFSGAFRLLPNGHNQRAYDINQIVDYQPVPWSATAN